uniref:Uncharacterized protein n=1 Tax=Parascaris univalens TaxID=6257 RepID=A0A915C7K2_PARUN
MLIGHQAKLQLIGQRLLISIIKIIQTVLPVMRIRFRVHSVHRNPKKEQSYLQHGEWNIQPHFLQQTAPWYPHHNDPLRNKRNYYRHRALVIDS